MSKIMNGENFPGTVHIECTQKYSEISEVMRYDYETYCCLLLIKAKVTNLFRKEITSEETSFHLLIVRLSNNKKLYYFWLLHCWPKQ